LPIASDIAEPHGLVEAISASSNWAGAPSKVSPRRTWRGKILTQRLGFL